jgi:hypothetical protein
MRTRVIRPKELISSIKPGSFLELELAPGKYIYTRKLNELSGYVYYDFLTDTPQKDIYLIAQQPVLLRVSLLTMTAPTWPIVGWLPLESDWLPAEKHWTVEPLPLTVEEMRNQVIKPDTEYFLIEHIEGETKHTPAKPEDLRGLTRWTLYPPEVVEEKLRLHYGLTKQGAHVEPVPLLQQELW